MQPGGYNAYRRVQTETSSPGELVMMLYNALAQDLQRAGRALEEDDIEVTHSSLTRAQDIVMELLASLDIGTGELARQLGDLYHYIYGRLVDANVGKDVGAVHEVAKIVTQLRDAWSKIVRSEEAADVGRVTDFGTLEKSQ